MGKQQGGTRTITQRNKTKGSRGQVFEVNSIHSKTCPRDFTP